MPKRAVISLISSATEMVAALGALDQLVGRSHECDYPPAVRALPCCTRPLIDVNADSRTIDRQVKNFVHSAQGDRSVVRDKESSAQGDGSVVRDKESSALSIYEVFDDVLERLQPTHILTQVQCDVCAVSLRDVERSIASRLASAPQLVALNPASLAGIWDDFRRVGEAVGVPAEPVIQDLQRRMRPVRSAHRPSIACIEWIEPLMAAGNWTPELIDLAGGIDVFGQPGAHSPWISWEDLLARDPDIVIVAPCGFDLARTRAEMHWLSDRPDFALLKAVRTGRFFLADGNQYFNRPGPRVAETLTIVQQIIGTAITNVGTASDCGGDRWTLYSNQADPIYVEKHR